jgi:hypothetical protein
MEANMTDNNDDDIYEDIEDADLPPETQGALAWAMLQFNCKFSEYIKEMNPELWKKAVDYAVTFTSVDGITFEYVKTAEGEDVIANVEIIEVDEDEEDYDDEGSDDEWKDLEDDAD